MIRIHGYNPIRIAGDKRKKSMEKLASALRINRAGDDAAGLAVSQSMRAQMRILEQSKDNVKDGISLVQTAEGAAQEIHSMLNRMLELSGQSANGTYSELDRANIQKEFDYLQSEIDRIANTANFNGRLLLNGDLHAVPEINEEEVCTTIQEQTGVTHKNAVMKGASWEGEIDFSTIQDGATITINGVAYEFNSDGHVNNTSAVAINVSAGDSAADKASALQQAINNNKPLARMDSCTLTVSSGDVYTLKMTTPDTAVVHGEGFHVSASSGIPDVIYGTTTITEGDATIGWGREMNVTGIDLDTIVDGTVFEFNGVKFEADLDGIASAPGATVIDLTGNKAAKLETVLSSVVTGGSVGLYQEGGSVYTLNLTYDAYGPINTQPASLRFNFGGAAAPAVQATSNTAGINTPEIFPREAKRVDEIDFSKVLDGSVITIAGHKFEFDMNGETLQENCIYIDASKISRPSDMAELLQKAVQNAGIVSLTMTTSALDDNRAEMTFTAADTIDGDQISLSYYFEGPPAGLSFQIGEGPPSKMRVSIEGMTTQNLNISGINIRTAAAASFAVEKIKLAINAVSENRGALGQCH